VVVVLLAVMVVPVMVVARWLETPHSDMPLCR
jgi:hypothetical protein